VGPRRLFRWFRRSVLLVVLVVVGYLGVTFAQVWMASGSDDRTPSSAIVVLGAAQWNGKPSPVLAERLDHAAELYKAGVAPMVIVTGGKQSGDRVTQGMAGFQYLLAKGVPEKALKVEVDGTNTYEEISAAGLIVRNAGTAPNVTLVSDGYHMLRARSIAGELGLRSFGSPTSAESPSRSLVRETAAVAAGRIVSFRRLSNWA